jgi:hypothetical protein
MASNSLEKSEKNPNEKKFEKYEWLVSCYDIIKSFKPISSEEKSMSNDKSSSTKKKSYLSNIKNKGKNFFDTLQSKKSSNKKKNSKSNGLNEQTSFEPNVAFVTEHFQNIRNSNNININNKIDSKSIKSRQSYLQSVNSIGDVVEEIEDSIKVEDSISNIKPNEDVENQNEKETNNEDEKNTKIPIINVDDSKEGEVTVEKTVTENKELDQKEFDDANLIAATVVESVLKSSLQKLEMNEQQLDDNQKDEREEKKESANITNQIETEVTNI